MTGEPLGRIAITWPAAHNPPSVLGVWGITIEDLDSGEQLLDVVGLRLELGAPEGWADKVIEATLTRLAAADGKPIGAGPGSANRLALTEEYAAYREQRGLNRTHPGDDFPEDEFEGQQYRTTELRYIVSEMRIAQRREPRAAQYTVGGLGPAPTAFDTEARTIAETQAARDGS